MTHALGDWIDAPADDRLIYGVVVGLVTNIEDPDQLGRVKVTFPWLSSEEESTWARIATLMAGKEMGTLFIPEINDEVLVAFEHGRPEFPVVIGSLWNGKDKPPEPVEKDNDVRLIKSRSGHVIRLTDKKGGEKIEIIDAKKENQIVIDTKAGSISIKAKDPVTIEAGGDFSVKAEGDVTIEGKKVTIKSTGDAVVQAGGKLEAKSSATTTIKGATVNIN